MGPFHRTLIIETSGRIGSVSLASGDALYLSRNLSGSQQHARDLALEYQKMLNELGWVPQETTSVIVNLGPGSFTGLRVGLVSGKAIAYSLGIPLFGVTTFQAIYESLKEYPSVWLLADAQQKDVYRQQFERDESGQLRISGIEVVPIAEVVASRPEKTTVGGPGACLYQEKFPTGLAPKELCHPAPQKMIDLVIQSLKEFEMNVMVSEPRYIRASSAEEKRAISTS